MALAVDRHPLTETAGRLTNQSQVQMRLVQEAFAEVDAIRRDLEIRFQELQSWQARLEQREVDLDERLTHLTNEIRLLTTTAETLAKSRIG